MPSFLPPPLPSFRGGWFFRTTFLSGQVFVYYSPCAAQRPFCLSLVSFSAPSSSQPSGTPYPNTMLSLSRADSQEEVGCLDRFHEQRPLLPNLFAHFAPGSTSRVIAGSRCIDGNVRERLHSTASLEESTAPLYKFVQLILYDPLYYQSPRSLSEC
jgi:hypothetical protein